MAAAGAGGEQCGNGVWCVLQSTLLGKASKIWEVRRKSIGSLQEVRSNFFLNRYPTRSMYTNLYYEFTHINLHVIYMYTCCAWAGGTFFPVVVLCQFLVLAGNRFWFYILMYLEYNTVVVLCQSFGSGGKQFLVLRTYLVYNSIVRLCQFFGCGGKQISK